MHGVRVLLALSLGAPAGLGRTQGVDPSSAGASPDAGGQPGEVGPSGGAASSGAFGILTLGDLEFPEGLQPTEEGEVPGDAARLIACYPTIRMADEGEAYFILSDPDRAWVRGTSQDPSSEIALWLPEGAEVRGRLCLPRPDWNSCSEHPFTLRTGCEPRWVDPAPFRDARDRARAVRIQGGSPGSSWLGFLSHRDRVGDVGSETVGLLPMDPAAWVWGRGTDVPRVPIHWSADPEEVERATEATEPMDSLGPPALRWALDLPDSEGPGPQIDPLAHWIPKDQPAIFFSSGEAFVEAVRHPGRFSLGTWSWLDRSPVTLERIDAYLAQWALAPERIGSLFHDRSVHGMAVTSGDLELDRGTDLALLLEARHGATFGAELEALVESAASSAGGTLEEGLLGVVPWIGFATKDRGRSVYLAREGDVVILCNSKVQLERWAAIRNDGAPSLGDHPELSWYRQRYPLGDPEERAFALLPSDAIQRWVSPPWRVARARGIGAQRLLEGVACQHLATLLDPPAEGRMVQEHLGLPGGGAVWIEPSGPRCETYGTSRFVAPASERLPRFASAAEFEAYRAFATELEGSPGTGAQAFGARWCVRDGEGERNATLDVTVLPREGFEPFGELASFVGRAGLDSGEARDDAGSTGPDPGPPTSGLFRLTLAIDRESDGFAELRSSLQGLGSATLLDLLGNEVSIFGAPQGDFWRKTYLGLDLGEEDSLGTAIPLGLRWELSEVEGAAERFEGEFAAITEGPLGEWLAERVDLEWRDHAGHPYLRAFDGPTGEEGDRLPWGHLPRNPEAYAALIGDHWVVTLSESLLLEQLALAAEGLQTPYGGQASGVLMKNGVRGPVRATDPVVLEERSSTDSVGTGAAPDGVDGDGRVDPRVGAGILFEIHGDMPVVLQALSGRSMANAGRLAAWAHLPILESLQREFPDAVPQDVYGLLYGERVRSPSGEEPRMHLGERALFFGDLGTPWIDLGSAEPPPWFARLRRGNFSVHWGEAGDLRVISRWVEGT